MTGVLTEERWTHLWTKNDLSAFHKNYIHPDLMKHENEFLPKPCRVFVPLCGKSQDIVYLANKGHDVYGCEYIAKAVEDFFTEQSLQYEVSTHKSGKFQIWKAVQKKITIYQGSFYDLNSTLIGKFDAIWDRASLVAINVDDRIHYSEIMHDLMSSKCKYLLNSYIFHGETYRGPPHSISEEVVQKLFGNFCYITFLDSHEGDIQFENAGFMEVTNRMLKFKEGCS